MNPSNRRKILYVSQDRISDLIRQKENTHKVVYSSDVPETAKLLWTFFCYDRAAFAFVFEDESFDEVPEGQQYPTIPTEAFVVWQKKQKEEAK